MRILFSYLKPHLFYFVLAYIAVIISSLTLLAFGNELKKLLDSIVTISNIKIINHTLFFIFIMVLIIGLTSFFRMWLNGCGSYKVISDIRGDLYRHIISLPPNFFESIDVSKIMNVLITDTSMLQTILSNSMSFLLRSSTTLIGSLIMLFTTNFKLSLYIIFIVPLILIIFSIFSKRVKKLSKTNREQVDLLSAFSQESFIGIKVVQSFVKEGLVKSKFSTLINNSLSIAKQYIILRSFFISVVITVVTGFIGLIIWFGIKEVLNNNITFGTLTSFIFYSALAAGAINSIVDNINEIQKAGRISENISDILSINTNIIDDNNPITLDKIDRDIVIKDLTFYYPSKPMQPALKNINLTINKGETLALVGPSGGGKSTIINMLLRFYDPNIGCITIDGVDIKKLSLRNLRSLFSVIPQDPLIFSGTILENITYGIDNIVEEQVKWAAELSNSLDFIERLPNKFDTFVGERGLRLSEGQKQRIIIARAIIMNPQVLIMDEATSSLDAENELLIKNSLDKLMKTRTMIIIAHRLSTVIKADRIILINDGQIEQEGTHQELMQNKDGLYLKLAKLQLYQDV